MLGFESLFPCQNEAPQKCGAFFRSGRGIEDSHHSAVGAGFAFVAQSASSSLASGKRQKSSSQTSTPIPRPSSDGRFSFLWRVIEDSHHSAVGAGFAFAAQSASSLLVSGKRQNLHEVNTPISVFICVAHATSFERQRNIIATLSGTNERC